MTRICSPTVLEVRSLKWASLGSVGQAVFPLQAQGEESISLCFPALGYRLHFVAYGQPTPTFKARNGHLDSSPAAISLVLTFYCFLTHLKGIVITLGPPG